MNIITQCLLYIYTLLLINFIKSSYEKEFTIRSNDSSFYDLSVFIRNNLEEDLVLYFVNDYYDLSVVKEFKWDINIMHDIYFIGNKNGTIFDYKKGQKGNFTLIYSRGKGETVKFENIIFQNYYKSDVNAININASTDMFHFEMNNCTVRNIEAKFLLVDLICNKQMQIDPQVIIRNSNF